MLHPLNELNYYNEVWRDKDGTILEFHIREYPYHQTALLRVHNNLQEFINDLNNVPTIFPE